MPYISEMRRGELNAGADADTLGDLSFVLATEIAGFIKKSGPRPSFAVYAGVEGVLQTLSKEVYRRLTAKLEESKLAENGDVFEEVL